MAMKNSSKKKRHKRVQKKHMKNTNSKRVRFFKTMVGEFSQHMSVPTELTTWFNENLSKKTEIINLKGPSGKKWHIGLTKSASNIFFQFGWAEFARVHCIEENDNLLFEYEGDCCFSVLIFDSHACERESAYFAENAKQDVIEESSLNCHESYSDHSASSHDNHYTPEESSGRKESYCSKRATQNGQNNAMAAEIDAAMQLARAFTSTRPSFLRVMRGYNVVKQFKLVIPSEFAKKHLSESREIILRVPNENSEWMVSLWTGESSYLFARKWRYFVRDNKLQEGDVCVFQLSSMVKKRIAMIVHIFRAQNK